MKGKLVFALCLLLLLSCLSCTMFSQTKVKAETLPVHNLNTGLDYATIQDAIDAYQTVGGNTIEVDAGTYYEHIGIYKSITLVGEDRNTTTIDGNGTGTVINIESDNVRILNFTIRNSGPNFPYSGTGEYDALIFGSPSYNNLDIENNTLLNSGGSGIALGVSHSLDVNNNCIFNVTVYGIDVGNPALFATYNVTVSNNTVRDIGIIGIGLDGDIENSTIENNSVEECAKGITIGPNAETLLVPSNNLIEENSLSNNSVTNILILSLTSKTQSSYSNTFRRNNLTNTLDPNIIVWGLNLGVFNQDIDSSNTANNKLIYYVTNQSNVDIDPSNYTDAGYLALVNCANVTARNFDLTDNKDGMLLAGVTNSTLTNVTLGDNRPYLTQTATNESSPAYWGGLTLFESSNNTITDSKICNDTVGVSFYHSDNNLLFHNSFIGNDVNVLSDFKDPYTNKPSGYTSMNLWDNGYPSGGNYWSDYSGTDLYHGPFQNETDSDGIGDTPYVIGANNTDYYPLMGTFQSFNVSSNKGLPVRFEEVEVVVIQRLER